MELVSDIFITLKLNASAEACAKKAVKSIKEETHPILVISSIINIKTDSIAFYVCSIKYRRLTL